MKKSESRKKNRKYIVKNTKIRKEQFSLKNHIQYKSIEEANKPQRYEKKYEKYNQS